MAARRRLDAELVRRKLARSRAHAAELIAAGQIKVRGIVATKAASGVDPAVGIQLVGEVDDYVSRGAHKLQGALRDFKVDPSGMRCLDAGASTGGFTDVLLRNGAAAVAAVDVGYGQLAWSLRTDNRVTIKERTNIRHLSADDIGGAVDITVVDLSFISLRLVLAALTACTRADGILLPMVKPQFEVGKHRVPAGGVIADPSIRAEAVREVAAAADAIGWQTVGVTPSKLPGPSGNVEFFCALRKNATAISAAEITDVVLNAGDVVSQTGATS